MSNGESIQSLLIFVLDRQNTHGICFSCHVLYLQVISHIRRGARQFDVSSVCFKLLLADDRIKISLQFLTILFREEFLTNETECITTIRS